MSFDITLADKNRPEALPVSPQGSDAWHRLIINDEIAFPYPFRDCTYDHELDLFGSQPATRSLRMAGVVIVQFIRLPTGDRFGYASIPVDPSLAHWGDVTTPRRYVSSDPDSPSYAEAFGLEVLTRTPNLKLVNRVVNADRRHKAHAHKVTIAGKTYTTTVVEPA